MTPDQIARFTGELDGALADGEPLGIAVSGGGDSLALLLLAQAARPGLVQAATVDHGLRAGSADEAAMVARVCAERAIPHAVFRPARPLDGNGGNLQARARTARYDALAGWATAQRLPTVATAHHVDDQAETLLMRASRGAGVAGLSGVRARGHWRALTILRPLLNWRRSELLSIVEAAGLMPADDPTNYDSSHDRTRFRALIAESPELDAPGLARAAHALADARDALEWSFAALAIDRLVSREDAIAADPYGLPREYRRRLAGLALAELGAPPPRGPALDRLLTTLDNGGVTTLGGVRAQGGALWRFTRAPARRKGDVIPLPLTGDRLS